LKPSASHPLHFMRRTTHEPAFVLHRYDWSETSLILEVFTRHQGRVALVAKGAKRPSSQFRPILLPLQLLSIAFSGDAEVMTLKGAEWQGGQTMPTGEALLSGYHLNELLMKLLARDDPHEQLFDAYAQAVSWLRDADQLDASLRAFELLLLREIGLLPALDAASLSHTPLEDDVRYSLVPELGLREAGDLSEQAALSAAAWRDLQTALDQRAAVIPVREVVSGLKGAERAALKQQLRHLLNFHTGGRGLRTRQLMMDVQALS
jgi:DNA repair protein RecO (recombination protein O)